MLKISRTLELPLDIVTQATAILAKRGAGKTYTGAVLVEEALDAGVPVAVLDPVGAWWGLRSKADGERKGYSIPIFGGEHADVPLEEAGGKILADFVVEERASAILDLKLFRKGQATRFATDFLEHLYRRNREPLLLVMEEADFFAPQKPRPEGARLLGAAEDIVRRGRMNGLGVVLITQRSAVLNKDVLTQADVLVVLRTTGPQDQKAMDEWIKLHGDEEQRREFLASLSGMKTGEAWVWAPELRIFQRVNVRRRRTYDSSAAPKVGAARTTPKGYADIDFDVLRRRMADAIEKAKAEDPAELRRQLRESEKLRLAAVKRAGELEELVPRVAELERELGERQEVEVPMLDAAALEQLRDLLVRFQDGAELVEALVPELRSGAGDVRAAIELATRTPEPRPIAPMEPVTRAALEHATPPPVPLPAAPPLTVGEAEDAKLKAGARRMVTALASVHPHPLTRVQLGLLADVKSTGGTFSDYLSSLRKTGLITEDGGGRVALTAAGVAYAGPAIGKGALSVGELRQIWEPKLKAGARRMLDVLIAVHPDTISRAELAERSGVSAAGGTFSDYLSSLRRAHLAEDHGAGVRAGAALFISEQLR